MNAIVVDASALASLMFEEPGAAGVLARIEGRELCAPALLAFELANAAWRRATRLPSERAMVSASLGKALAMRIRWMPVAHVGVLELAFQTGLTAYDASYLWLARQLRAPLVTLDRRLAKHVRS